MKHRLESDREFNPPAEMLARATFAATLAALALGILLTVGGVVVWELQWSLAGLGVLGLAWAGRVLLQRRGDVEPAAREWDRLCDDIPPPDEGRASELMRLLERWETLEAKRGTAEFDPWALQALRNEIRVAVESDPALEALFTRLRSAA